MLRASKIVVTPAWRELLRVHHLDTVDAVYQTTAGQAVTLSGSTEVRRITLGDAGREQVVYLKKYWVNRARQLWSGMLRGTFFGRSKARREFENLGLLRDWGLAAPEPVAYGEDRRAHWLVRSFLISAGIPDPVSLDVFIRDRLARPDRNHRGPQDRTEATNRRRALIESLADATRQLHKHHFVHHDYFWRNIILSGKQFDRFWLIDAHKGRVWSTLQDERSRAADLAALDAPAIPYFSRTERLRFFLRYCNQRRLDGPTRDLLQSTLRLAEPLRGKQRQRVEQAGREIPNARTTK